LFTALVRKLLNKGSCNTIDPLIQRCISQNTTKAVLDSDVVRVLGDDLIDAVGDSGRPFEGQLRAWNNKSLAAR
jgi:hypothetical protein